MTTIERVLILVFLVGVVSYACVLVARDVRETRVDVELAEILADKQAVIDDTEEGRF